MRMARCLLHILLASVVIFVVCSDIWKYDDRYDGD